MFLIRRTEEFAHWLGGLKDHLSRARLIRRLGRARQGHLGGVKAVGESVFKMREHFGPGWRMYHFRRGDESSQSAGIARAIRLAAEYDE